jgi:hypothetical protein
MPKSLFTGKAAETAFIVELDKIAVSEEEPLRFFALWTNYSKYILWDEEVKLRCFCQIGCEVLCCKDEKRDTIFKHTHFLNIKR